MWSTSSALAAAIAILAVCCTDAQTTYFPSECPDMYFPIEDKCLMNVTETRSFNNAKKYCVANGGELAQNIDSCSVFEAILRYVDSHADLKYHDFWVGGSDGKVEGDWRWLNGDPVDMGSIYWGVNENQFQPNGGEVENCICMHGPDRHSFHDCECGKPKQFFCQADPLILDQEYLEGQEEEEKEEEEKEEEEYEQERYEEYNY